MTEETVPKTRLNMAACYNKVEHISQQEYEELYKRCDSTTRRRLTLCYKQVRLTRVPQSAASKRASATNFANGAILGARQQCLQAIATIDKELKDPTIPPAKQVHLRDMKMRYTEIANLIWAASSEIKYHTAQLTELRKQK